jgi:oxygen-independent coproporphyrinogen-3 oxidase
VNGVRWRNLAGTAEYVDRVTRQETVMLDRREMPVTERIEEALFTGLRMNDGIDEAAFAVRWGLEPWARYTDVLSIRREAGHVWRDERQGRFGLTRAGMLVANDVLSELI